MSKASVNKAIIVGNLGADPETRYTAGGTAVTNCNIATSDTWRDKSSGEMQERTEWHRVVFFARLAEVVGEYLTKGSKVYVEGRIQTRKWQDQSGQDRYTTEIVANEMQMLDSRSGGGSSAGQGGSNRPSGQSSNQTSPKGYSNASRGGSPAPSQDAPAATQGTMAGGGFDDDLDDDIPFDDPMKQLWAVI